MKVKEIMQKKVISVKPTDSIQKVCQLMHKFDIGFMVIESNQEAIGVITDRDLMLVLAKEINTRTPIEKVMKKYVSTISLDSDISDASDMMGYLQIRRLVVVDNANKIVGILSIADLVRNIFSEEDGYNAITEISYDFSTKNLPNDNFCQTSAYKI